jgi:hypothetical protein
MSLYLNDPEKLFVPTQDAMLEYCFVRSPANPRRFILTQRHDVQVIAGERICVRCWRLMREIEEALEAREKEKKIPQPE